MNALDRLIALGVAATPTDDGRLRLSGLSALDDTQAAEAVTLARESKLAILADLGAVHDAEALARFRESHPHLACCPCTRPAWNWRPVSWCVTRCPTPCTAATPARPGRGPPRGSPLERLPVRMVAPCNYHGSFRRG